VITDILMPDGDGIEVIRALKKAQPHVRIIAVSGGGRHLEASECLKLASGLGAHGVLRKPFRREELLRLVTQQLSVVISEKPA
jgi:CheY-like chemotaxis protein